MPTPTTAAAAAPIAASARDKATDEELVNRVRGGDLSSFELLMRRHNQRLYRAVRAILREGGEVEDVMQESYCSAFRHLDQLEGRARFGAWLLKIAINEALARLRGRSRLVALDELPEEKMQQHSAVPPSPEERAASHQMVTLIESAVDELPREYRQVFVLRVVDGLDTAETAEALDLSEDAIKQRLHRARAMVQARVEAEVGAAAASAFGFLGARCDRVVAGVMARITAG